MPAKEQPGDPRRGAHDQQHTQQAQVHPGEHPGRRLLYGGGWWGGQVRGQLPQLVPGARGVDGAQPLVVFVRGQPAGERLVEQGGGVVAVGVRCPRLGPAKSGWAGLASRLGSRLTPITSSLEDAR
jgi:hypothetical protein